MFSEASFNHIPTATRRNITKDRKFYQMIQNALRGVKGKNVSKNSSSSQSSSTSSSKENNSLISEAIRRLISKFSSGEINAIDSLVIRCQTIGLSKFLFILFLLISLGKYAEDDIFCVRQFDRTSADEDEEDLCLQYPYTEETLNGKDIKRHYVLFYRWFHLGLCFFSGYFYSLRIAVKFNTFQPLNQMIIKKKTRDGLSVCELKRYWQKYLGAHENIYIKKIYLHILCLTVNLCGFFLIDLLVQGKYIILPSFLFVTRDIEFFDDDMSFVFPPFVKCEISPTHQLWLERRELFGCHLTHMIVYEKLIFIIWFYQLVLAIWCVAYLCMLIAPFLFNFFKNRLLVQGFYQYTKLTDNLGSLLCIGDSYAFGLMTDYLTTKDFTEFQQWLLDQVDNLDL